MLRAPKAYSEPIESRNSNQIQDEQHQSDIDRLALLLEPDGNIEDADAALELEEQAPVDIASDSDDYESSLSMN